MDSRKEDFLNLLRSYEKSGIELIVGNNTVSSGTVYLLCEDNDYMGDYIGDEHGKLSQIRFNKINTY